VLPEIFAKPPRGAAGVMSANPGRVPPARRSTRTDYPAHARHDRSLAQSDFTPVTGPTRRRCCGA